MPHSLTLYILAVLFLATLIRSTLGFGEALIAVPLLALRTPITVAAPLAQLVSVLVALVVIAQDYRHVRFKSAAALLAFALPGIPLGLLLLLKTNEHLVKTLLGALIILFSAYSLSRKHHAPTRHPWPWLATCGFLSGVLGGAYGMNGPPLAVYGGLRNWSPQHFRATLQAYFLPASLAGLLGYASTGVWNATVSHTFLLALPLLATAILLGRALNRRLKTARFFRLLYAALLLLGALLILQSLLPP